MLRNCLRTKEPTRLSSPVHTLAGQPTTQRCSVLVPEEGSFGSSCHLGFGTRRPAAVRRSFALLLATRISASASASSLKKQEVFLFPCLLAFFLCLPVSNPSHNRSRPQQLQLGHSWANARRQLPLLPLGHCCLVTMVRMQVLTAVLVVCAGANIHLSISRHVAGRGLATTDKCGTSPVTYMPYPECSAAKFCNMYAGTYGLCVSARMR
jgi:hypothetical protein